MRIDAVKIGLRVRDDLGELSELAKSIENVGLLHPIVVRPDGTLIAGMRRLEACTTVLGWQEIDVNVVRNLEDVSLALRAEGDENAMRKELTPVESVKLSYLLEPMERGAARERQQLLSNPETSPVNFSEPAGRALDKVASAVGMSRPTLMKAREIVEAAESEPEIFGDLAEYIHRTGKVDGAHKKLEARQVQAKRLEAARRGLDAVTPDGAQLLHGDFYEVMKGMQPASVDTIVTDPPYPHEYLPLFEDLAAQAARVLKPGGSMLVMAGQSYLPEVLRLLCVHMRYHWTAAYLTPGGQAAQIWPRKVNTFWKPLLWFVNGDYAGEWIGDVTKSAVNDNDKAHHEWGQSESGMLDILDRFTELGNTVLDPFCGAGTTGVAALKLGRKFIGIDNDIEQINIAKLRLGDLNAK